MDKQREQRKRQRVEEEGGKGEKVEVEDAEEGMGVEARSQENYRSCQTIQFCRRKDLRVGRGPGWSHEKVEQGWELRQDSRWGCHRFQGENQSRAPPFLWPHTRAPLFWIFP
jgi:hypothetical protein